MIIDQHELALRMLEAAVGLRRPPNKTAEEALALAQPNLRTAYMRAAGAAVAYFVEQGARIEIDPAQPSETENLQRVQ